MAIRRLATGDQPCKAELPDACLELLEDIDVKRRLSSPGGNGLPGLQR